MPFDARQTLRDLEQHLTLRPPPGLPPAYVRGFFERNQVKLLRVLTDGLTTVFRPFTASGARAGDELSLEQAWPGARVVTSLGEHGAVLEAGGGLVAVKLDSGRTARVRQVFHEWSRPRRLEPDVLYEGEWVSPKDFVRELGLGLERLMTSEVIGLGERRPIAVCYVRCTVSSASGRAYREVDRVEESPVCHSQGGAAGFSSSQS